MIITLRDFSVGGFTFRQSRGLDRIQRLLVGDLITQVVRTIPETTTCEGDLRDPRCTGGHGDVNDIFLGAFNARRELKGALNFSAINFLRGNGNGRRVVVETHPTPAFPEMSVDRIAAFISTVATFVLSNNLESEEGPLLQIRGLNYALEIPFTAGGKFEDIHRERIGGDFETETKIDPTRPGRNLHSFKQKRVTPGRP